MHILDLPLELLREILFRSIQSRGLRRGFRLRLVNKIFAQEVVESIFAYRLLDNYFASDPNKTTTSIPPYILAYLERCVVTEPAGFDTAFAWIRTVAEYLSRADTNGRDTETFVRELCPFVIEEHGPHVARLWRQDLGHDTAYLETHMYVAAVMTNTTPVIEAWLAHECQPNVKSFYFGYTRTYAERYGDQSLLTAMMTHPWKDQTSQQKPRLYVFAGTVEAGRMDAARFTFNFNTIEYPWHFSRPRTRRRRDRPKELYYARENKEWLATMHTPSKEVFDFLMEKRGLHCIDRHFGPEQWTIFLHHCASRGWQEMASIYLELGASVNGQCRANVASETRPLIKACIHGHLRVVELLLKWRADVSAPALETAAHHGHTHIVKVLLSHGAEVGEAAAKAAAKGYRNILQTLLDHGANIPDEQRLLAYAIEHEDELMFQTVLRSGSAGALADCVAYAEARGLESMLDLLATT
ncbi:ankyrin repeat-containing domain protein [Paraphoma chrysanthemicola]|nr:ankyrin repeat-containing domain protein [Paraphoma chrysanthemicola]